MYKSIQSAYPKAEITTIGECDGPENSRGLTSYIQVALTEVPEYELHATIGSPDIDIMVMSMPKVTEVTFKDHKKELGNFYLRLKPILNICTLFPYNSATVLDFLWVPRSCRKLKV